MWGLFSSKKTCKACEDGVDSALIVKAVEIVKIAQSASEDGKLTRKERSAVMKGMWSLLKQAEPVPSDSWFKK
jgi:predicted oxidoreductase